MDRRASFVHVPNWSGNRLDQAARAVEDMAKVPGSALRCLEPNAGERNWTFQTCWPA